MLIGEPPSAPSEPEALFEEARRHRRRRRIRLSLLVAAGVAAAAGGFYAAFGGGSAHVATVGSIRVGAAAQRARAHDLIIRDTRRFGVQDRRPGRSIILTDLATGNQLSTQYDQNGRASSAWAMTVNRDDKQPTVADVTQTLVAYVTHNWLQFSHHEPLANLQRQGSAVANPFEGRLSYRLLGRDTVDGVQTYHLRALYPHRRAVAVPSRVDVWLASSDYRLVRREMGGPRGIILTEDFRWLPRTPANLARLKLVVPPGYTHHFSAPVIALTAKPPTPPTAPLQQGVNRGVEATVGANGSVIFDTRAATKVVRRTLGGRNTNFTCFRTGANKNGLTTVASGTRSGGFARQVGFQLEARAPFDGCELNTGYGQRWPGKFAGHDAVEIAFTAAGRRFFADRAAARQLSMFVRSRRLHEIRHLAPPQIAAGLSTTYGGSIVRLTGRPPAALPADKIGYTLTPDGAVFHERSSTGRTFTVQIRNGRIVSQNVKPLGYVF